MRSEHGRGYVVVGADDSRGLLVADGNPGDPRPWRVHGERTVYDDRWVRLSLADVERPGMDRFEHHVVRLLRVAVAMIIDDDHRVLMMWRYRLVAGRFGWELPGGIVKDGENGAETAVRESEEETGWRPVRCGTC